MTEEGREETSETQQTLSVCLSVCRANDAHSEPRLDYGSESKLQSRMSSVYYVKQDLKINK